MKKQILLLLTTALFASCNDWLDVSPEDKQLEKDLYATEFGIRSATNGLYRELIGTNLYGGQLSQTTVEVMGHVYTYPVNQPATEDPQKIFYDLAKFKFDTDAAQERISSLWSSAYATLLHLNTYLRNVEESPANMPQANKNLLLGEAYGLRAYLHFDLFRLFGPAWKDRNSNKILYYYNRPDMPLNHENYEETEYSSADEYMALLWADVVKAEDLLQNDPIIANSRSVSDTLLGEDFYTENRNRRMNYYAVKGLRARIHQYCGDYALAAEAAKFITDQVGDATKDEEKNRRFKWVKTAEMNDRFNYVFFSEVIFGINNLQMYANATTWYKGSDIGYCYEVEFDHLMENVLGYGSSASLPALTDIRARQWVMATEVITLRPFYPASHGYYRSRKYDPIPSNALLPALTELQVLMRISEMFYIQAEAAMKAGRTAEAITILNDLATTRRLAPAEFRLPDNATEQAIQAHLEKEYYREFFGEGQIFFYHKRLSSTSMFKGNEPGSETIADPATAFVVPVPNSEKDI